MEQQKQIEDLIDALNAFGVYFDELQAATKKLKDKLEPFAKKTGFPLT